MNHLDTVNSYLCICTLRAKQGMPGSNTAHGMRTLPKPVTTSSVVLILEVNGHFRHTVRTPQG